MKTLSRRALCLVVLAGLLAPLAVFAQDDAACESGDTECMALAYSTALATLFKGIEDTRLAFGDYFAYLSARFDVDLRFDENGQEVLRGLYPRLTKLIEEDVAVKYGILLPLRTPGGKSSKSIQLIAAKLTGAVGTAAYAGELSDGRYREAWFNSIVQDLERRGWPPEVARLEANHQFTTYIGPVSSFLLPVMHIHNLLKQLEIIASGEHYNAWAFFHRGRIREIMENRRSHRGPDNGRSYAQWAAEREGSLGGGGDTSGCRVVIWVPASSEWDPETNTLTVIAGHWQCIS
jgi:hypothetical protein